MSDILFFIILSFLWWQFLAAFAVSAGLHRYFSHGAFKASLWYEYAVLFLAPLSGSSSVLGWVGVHRLHHRYSDTPQDPHSPRYVGFWKVVTSTFPLPVISTMSIRDMLKNKRVVWFHKNHRRIRVITFVVGFLVLPLGYFLALIVAPVVYGRIGFGLLNALCHFRKGVENSWFANIFTGGDGWHANHHRNQSYYNNSEAWWQWDPGAWLIYLIRTNRVK